MNYTERVYQEVILCLIHISIINDNKGLGTSRRSFSYHENTYIKLRAFPGTPAAFRLRINIRVLGASVSSHRDPLMNDSPIRRIVVTVLSFPPHVHLEQSVHGLALCKRRCLSSAKPEAEIRFLV